MATSFNLTAQLNLRGPTNLKPIVADIRRQLGTISTDVKINIDDRSARSVDVVSTRLRAMNDILVKARQNTIALNSSLKDLSASLGTVQSAGNRAAQGMGKTADTAAKSASNIRVARTEMEEFGRQSALAVRRFAAFTVVTSSIFALTNAITSGFKAFIQFDKELIRLQQVTGKGKVGIQGLENEITKLATSLGVSSESLTSVATTLAQAGLSANETRIALSALAKTELAPSFQNLTKTTEGAIAAIRQFSLGAGDLEAALGSINAVAAAFAVESGDIIAAIQRTGGVFASASKGVSEGKDALNEFIAVFTSVRATTRESAETIATGLRTIFTRIQRAKTIDQLKEFGVQLQDIEGKFVGPFEAVKRLSAALNQLDPRDIRFSTIVEELGGFRQIGKVIPLIQQFATAQQALGVAQRGQSSLTDAQIIAQQSLANQIAKVREQFLALIRDIGKSSSFQGLFKIVTGLTSGLISLAGAFKPILPILAIFGAIKGISAVGQFGAGLFG
jgi:TP901 family phage tail tape measure protein